MNRRSLVRAGLKGLVILPFLQIKDITWTQDPMTDTLTNTLGFRVSQEVVEDDLYGSPYVEGLEAWLGSDRREPIHSTTPLIPVSHNPKGATLWTAVR